MILPPAVKRVQYYSRNSHQSYVHWVISEVGIQDVQMDWYEELLVQSTRSAVDDMVTEKVKHEHVEAAVEKTPSWVNAAFDVLKDRTEDVAEAIEKFFEDDDSPPLAEEVDDEKPVWVDTQDDVYVEHISQIAEEEIVEEVFEVNDEDNPFGGEVDYNSYTVRELQKLCKERGITIRGTKSEVVLRLRRDDEGIVEQPTEGEIEVPSQEATDIEPDAPSQEAATEEVTQHDDSRQEQPDYEEE